MAHVVCLNFRFYASIHNTSRWLCDMSLECLPGLISLIDLEMESEGVFGQLERISYEKRHSHEKDRKYLNACKPLPSTTTPDLKERSFNHIVQMRLD